MKFLKKLFIVVIGLIIWLLPSYYYDMLGLLSFTWLPALMVVSYLEE